MIVVPGLMVHVVSKYHCVHQVWYVRCVVRLVSKYHNVFHVLCFKFDVSGLLFLVWCFWFLVDSIMWFRFDVPGLLFQV